MFFVLLSDSHLFKIYVFYFLCRPPEEDETACRGDILVLCFTAFMIAVEFCLSPKQLYCFYTLLFIRTSKF